MIIQVPGPLKDAAFIASNVSDPDQRKREIEQWTQRYGYAQSQPDHVFAIFQDGHVVREWNLLQKSRQ